LKDREIECVEDDRDDNCRFQRIFPSSGKGKGKQSPSGKVSLPWFMGLGIHLLFKELKCSIFFNKISSGEIL